MLNVFDQKICKCGAKHDLLDLAKRNSICPACGGIVCPDCGRHLNPDSCGVNTKLSGKIMSSVHKI